MDENNKPQELIEEIKKEVKNEVEDAHKIDFALDSLNLSKTNIINILEDIRVIKKRFSHIENIIKESERSQYRPSKDMPGITGTFDGEHMITSDGQKLDVPKNYAAKSLLVFGDELKRMEQDGKEAYKILTKVPRKKIEGLLSKKDGKYVILSDLGTFNLSKNAVEFRNIKQGEWILAMIPEKGPTGNFAAIDKVIKKDKNKDVKFFDVKKEEKKLPVSKTSFQPKPQDSKPHTEPKKNQPKSDQPKSDNTPASVSFDSDDLV